MRKRKKNIQTSEPVISISFQDYPAKTWIQPDGKTAIGHSVLTHCHIVGEIAKELISRFPIPIRHALFPTGSEVVAAAHDIGKVSPSFNAKILKACGIDHRTIPALALTNPNLESQWGGHAGVSQLTAKELQAPKYVPEILGQHHGFSPSVGFYSGKHEAFGGEQWFQQRSLLVDELKQKLESDWPQIEDAWQARVIAGLTSVADWIGSGEFFTDPQVPWQPQIKTALKQAGFISPQIIPNLSFGQVFKSDGHSLEMQPHTTQSKFIDQVAGPGLYILEAQMGMGKTEAALYAAYKMLEQNKATGIYFALPTQLTSNKIHDRFKQFLSNIVSSTDMKESLLLHSGAWLLETELGEEGRPGGSWFHHKKRGLLAPFAVGTIDQALMAAMNVKHGFVRAFGLAGKVVILDEVHSYDLYTSTLLNALVKLLKQLHCTVIILSATLSQDRRCDLVGQTIQDEADYPLITAVSHQGHLTEIPVSVPHDPSITVKHSADEQAMEQALLRAETGQQVLWIENTVADAQQRYLELASRAVEIGCDIGLLHSRFTPHHRAKNEDKWVGLFGKPGWGKRSEQGRILIGTQVVEQSIDIDADFLISRFAPTDMLLQRLGRLWRHQGTPRAKEAKKECWLLLPSLDIALADPPKAFGSTAFVYAPYVLCRSLEVWQGINTLSLPSNIRTLIEQTYCSRTEDDHWLQLYNELEQGTSKKLGKQALSALATLTLSTEGKTLPEQKAQTRYSEQDHIDVLLLRHISSKDGSTNLELLDGTRLSFPHAYHQFTKAQWRQLAVTLHQQVVPVNISNSPQPIDQSTLRKYKLDYAFYLGRSSEDEAVLRLALVGEGDELLTLDRQPNNGNKKSLSYSPSLGYRAQTK